MKLIEKIPKLQEILVVWQEYSRAFDRPRGRQYIIGKVCNIYDKPELHYLDNKGLVNKGFQGLGIFRYDERKIHKENVGSVLSRRLPPKTRADYQEFLESFGISEEAGKAVDSLPLLSYTRGKLAGDSFSFYPVIKDSETEIQLTFDIAGFMCHGNEYFANPLDLKYKKVILHAELDSGAVAILREGKKLGYVPKGLQKQIGGYIEGGKSTASIERVSGSKESPSILIFFTCI